VKKTFLLFTLLVLSVFCLAQAPAQPAPMAPPVVAPVVAPVVTPVVPAAEPPAATTTTTTTTTTTEPVAAPVADVPLPESNVTDPGDTTVSLVAAAHKREWGLVVGFALMLLVWIVGFVWKALPSAWLPWLSLVLGVVGTVGLDLSHGLPWWRAMLTGLSTGMVSIGSWETLGRRLFGSRSKRLTKGKA